MNCCKLIQFAKYVKENKNLSQTNHEQKEGYLSKLMRLDNDYFLTVMWTEAALGHLCFCGLEIVFLDCGILQYCMLRDLKCPAICLFSKCVEST